MKTVNITVYQITGKQLFFTVPESVCKECDIVVRMVQRISKKLGTEQIIVQVLPWMNNIASALRKRSWHPPIILVNDKVFSQGIVPNERDLEDKISQELR